MYPYQNYNHQASYEQEWQDNQRGNFDHESYHYAINRQIPDLEERIERMGVQLAQCARYQQLCEMEAYIEKLTSQAGELERSTQQERERSAQTILSKKRMKSLQDSTNQPTLFSV